MSTWGELYKRHRDRMARNYISEKIPPEKRGMVTCPQCKGQGGTYTKEPGAEFAKFHGCSRCDLHGEITPEEAAKSWPRDTE